jgi:hypothetical protein
MALADWLSQNWFSLVQTLGIMGAFYFSSKALLADTDARIVQNRLAIGQQHFAIWSLLFSSAELGRVLDATADLKVRPITAREDRFLRFLILHLQGSFTAAKAGLYLPPENLASDIRSFFSLPIPKAVWEAVKGFQNADFVAFVERALGEPAS